MQPQNIPLAQRMRPHNLDQYVGQKHLVGENAVLRNAIQSGKIPSMILWGPPGVGKTTLASLISENLNLPFYTLSAVSSGVKEVRAVIDTADKSDSGAILFIDEIHRFSKSQQDSLLGAVEKGIVTLIGATTENPSFEVISALLSRTQVYILKNLTEDELINILQNALLHDEVLSKRKITLNETAALIRVSGGDARKLLNALELVSDAFPDQELSITDEKVLEVVQRNLSRYDKGGEMHYDIISAFIKSIRGSDPNAALYWLARMIESGEDLKFIARRLLILSSEDIGNANPTALVIANNTFQAVHTIGYPESRIILAQCVTYLAASPKSNAAYLGIDAALAMVRQTGDLPVPLHIRNAPTKLMKDLNYGKNYAYDHSNPANFSGQEFMPDQLIGRRFFEPGVNAREQEMRDRLKKLWGDKYGY